jgi:translin
MLSEMSSRIFENFEIKDETREKTLKLSRKMVRLSSRAIKSIHRDEFNEAKQMMDEVSKLNRKIKSLLEKHPDIYHGGFVENAQQEYAEAAILYHIIKENRIPEPAWLGVEDSAFLLGLGDVVGELRRIILDLIRLDEPDKAEKILSIMDDIYTTIMLFDFPDALSRGLRHKCDVARSIVERTRGDLTNAIENAKLKESMSELEKILN